MTRALLIIGDDEQVTDQPPTEGTTFDWSFPGGVGSSQYRTISNPNDVPMTIAWVEFPSANFTGPTTPVVIPAHSSRNFSVYCNGTVDTDSTTGTWTTSGGGGALTGNAECFV